MQYGPDDAEEVSFHPPHVEDSNGRLLPKALIPLCSYQGTMLGKKLKHQNFIACDNFLPSVLNGQLCYSLNLSQAAPSKSGMGNSVLIVLDKPDSLELNVEEKPVATFHLDSLGGFSDNRPGKYYMSSLKKMTGTDAFMSLSDTKKGCQSESYEECKMKTIFAALQRECRCIPLSLAKFFKVSQQNVRLPFPSPQHLPFCGPMEKTCVDNALNANHGCLVKCTGLYADVRYSEEDNKIPDMINDGDAKLLAMLKVGKFSIFFEGFRYLVKFQLWVSYN